MALSVAEQQYWINAALAGGYARADIDSFIANNGTQDLPRIMSALAPNPGPGAPGPGTGAPSLSVAVQRDAYAVPTPASNSVGQITQSSPSDGTIAGASPYGAPLSINVAPGSPARTTIVPSQSFPPWMILAALAVLALILMNRK